MAVDQYSNKKSMFIIGRVIILRAGLLFAYLMYYTATEESIKIVKR